MTRERADAPAGRRGPRPAPRAPLLVAERQRRIREALAGQGGVRVAELARAIRVSEETIRRDLRLLAAEGTAELVHGGAILRRAGDEAARVVPPVGARERLEQAAKLGIGQAAAARVRDGEVVILDAGSTTLAVARCLAGRRDLTIVTNSLTIAEVAATIPGATTHVIGGRLVPASLSMIGPKARRDLAPVRADWAFIGAAAIEPDGGFTSADPYEAEVKRAMIRAARHVAIVADHTKFGGRRFASFADAPDVHVVFTTPGLSAAARRWLEAANVEVVACGPHASDGT